MKRIIGDAMVCIEHRDIDRCREAFRGGYPITVVGHYGYVLGIEDGGNANAVVRGPDLRLPLDRGQDPAVMAPEERALLLALARWALLVHYDPELDKAANSVWAIKRCPFDGNLEPCPHHAGARCMCEFASSGAHQAGCPDAPWRRP